MGERERREGRGGKKGRGRERREGGGVGERWDGGEGRGRGAGEEQERREKGRVELREREYRRGIEGTGKWEMDSPTGTKKLVILTTLCNFSSISSDVIFLLCGVLRNSMSQ